MAHSTDLTDAQWNLLEPLLARCTKRGPKHGVDLRHVVDAMLYRSHTGGNLSVRVVSNFVADRDGEDSPPSANSEVVSYCPFEVQPCLLQDSR